MATTRIRHRGAALPRERLVEATRALQLYAVPAFLTDPLNRIVVVNAAFAALVGDPNRAGFPDEQRLVHAALLGPFRDRFPRGVDEVAGCVPSIVEEVRRGRLDGAVLRLIGQLLAEHPSVRRRAARGVPGWDGTVVVRDDRGRYVQVREQVVPLARQDGELSGYHVSHWVPVAERLDLGPPAISALAPLTPRQVEVARLYASGLHSREVAARLGITHRTARGHIEDIYARLGVHSSAELAVLMTRAGEI